MTRNPQDVLPAGLGDHLDWLLSQCFRAYVSALERAVSDIPHGLRGFQTLCAAVHSSAHSQAELGRQLGLDRTVMVYLVDDLVSEGLVERVPDPNDRRNKLIRATTAGRSRFAEAHAGIGSAEAAVLHPLTNADRTRFRDMLRAIAAHALLSAPS